MYLKVLFKTRGLKTAKRFVGGGGSSLKYTAVTCYSFIICMLQRSSSGDLTEGLKFIITLAPLPSNKNLAKLTYVMKSRHRM